MHNSAFPDLTTLGRCESEHSSLREEEGEEGGVFSLGVKQSRPEGNRASCRKVHSVAEASYEKCHFSFLTPR